MLRPDAGLHAGRRAMIGPLPRWAGWATLPAWLLVTERVALRAGAAPDDSPAGRTSALLLAAAAATGLNGGPARRLAAILAGSALLHAAAGHGAGRGWAAWGACAALVAVGSRPLPGRAAPVVVASLTAAAWTVAVAGAGGLRVAATYLAWTGAVAGVAGGLSWAAQADAARDAPPGHPWPLQAWGALAAGCTVLLSGWLGAPLHVPAPVLVWVFLARAWAGRRPTATRLPLAGVTGALVLVAAGWALA
jgi:hypothetical protein